MSNKKEKQISEIINQSCCGQMLDVPKTKLVKDIQKLELTVELLRIDVAHFRDQRAKLYKENLFLKKDKFSLTIGLWLLISCFYIVVFR